MPSQNEIPITTGTVIHGVEAEKLTLAINSQVRTRMYIYTAGDSGYSFAEMRAQMYYALKRADKLNRGKWQTLDVAASSMHDTHELRNVQISYTVPDTEIQLQNEVHPDLPWAEVHFQERVGGEPLNPPPSHVDWPYHGSDKERHLDASAVFSHTYPERFWPKRAGWTDSFCHDEGCCTPNRGYRYAYGDLDDVVGQLVANPFTRQAVLPVWFPEDTGSIDVRVPCTLSYHFMADETGRLSVWYAMRACDFYRHFHNDMYFAARLLQWVCTSVAGGIHEATGVYPHFEVGDLNVTISSLHLFAGDVDKLSP